MNTMTWLFLGHLVGDWLLQNDWMAKGKKKGFFSMPGLTHFAVYTMVLLGVLIFDGRGEYNGLLLFLVGLLIFLSHWILDATNIVERWMRFYHQTEAPMIRLMVDQTFHFVILALIAVWVNTW